MTFAFFTDFGMVANLEPSQLRESPPGVSAVNSPLYGCPQFVNGDCFGGYQLPTSRSTEDGGGDELCSAHVERRGLQVIMPIINAPFRIYYAYNPLRLYKDIPQELVAPGHPLAPALRSTASRTSSRSILRRGPRPTATSKPCNTMERTTSCASRVSVPPDHQHLVLITHSAIERQQENVGWRIISPTHIFFL